VKKWIYTVLVISSVTLWANDIKKNDIKADDRNKSSNAIKSMKSLITAPPPVNDAKKKKVSYPRGTIATH